MAANAGVTLDTITIEIESNAGKATTNIDALSSSLKTLRESMSGGFGNLKTLATYLEKLKETSKGFGQVTKNLGNIAELGKSLTALTNIPDPKNLKGTVKALQDLSNVFSKVDSGSIENMARVSKELSNALTPLAEKLKSISEGYKAINALADRYGVSVTKIAGGTKTATVSTDKLRDVFKATGKAINQAFKFFTAFMRVNTRPIEKLTKKILKMGLSLLGTRTIFTATRKAISEYLGLDQELADGFQNIWRALGAQLAPALEYVLYLFTQFTRVVYSIIKALTGIDLIARANAKAMDKMAKSSGKALGNLQKFDDLNVVDFGSGSGDNNLINLEEIDLTPIQKIMDWVRKLKAEIQSAWNTGQWEGVGKVFAEGMNAAMRIINTGFLRTKIMSIAEDFGDAMNGFFTTLNGGDLGKTIQNAITFLPDTLTAFLSEIPWEIVGKRLKEAIKKMDPKTIVNSIMGPMKTLLIGVFDVLKEQDWGVIAEKVAIALKTAFNNIVEIWNEVPWYEIGTFISEGIKKIDIPSILISIITSLGKALNELGNGLFGFKEDSIMGGIQLFGITAFILTLVGAFKLLQISSKMLEKDKGISKTTKSLSNLASALIILGGIVLILKEVAEILKIFGELGDKTGEAIAFIAVLFTTLGLAVGIMANSFSGLDWQAVAGGIVILGGLALVFETLAHVLTAFSETGASVWSILGLLGGTLILIVGLMAAVATLGPAMTTGLLPFGIVIAAIVLVLVTMAETLPIILDAVGNFVTTVAPFLIELLQIIANLIVDIIYALGDVLPPILEGIGGLFTNIFGGIALVVDTVGNTFVKILDAVGTLVERLFNSIINFIVKLGKTIISFVDDTLKALTKLINFITSGIEHLINCIVTFINWLTSGLRGGVNDFLEFVGVDFEIKPMSTLDLPHFAPKLETGTNEIPYEGIYHLHPGEAVVPKKYNPALGNGGNNEEMNQKLDTLIGIMNNMSFTNVVNVGNETLYKKQQKYNKTQNDKYGTTVNL